MRARFALLLIVVLVVTVGVILLLRSAPAAEQYTESEYMTITDDEVVITIPHGVGAAIEAGNAPRLVHGDIVLTLGAQDRLTIRNEDEVGHTVGLFYVGAGQTISQRFTTPQEYVATCSFQGGGIRLIVKEEA